MAGGKSNQAKPAEIYRRLRRAYPDAACALHHRNPFELLAATILSAQCTDVRVNLVTPGLFARYPGPREFAGADLARVEQAIRSTGFYRNKAKAMVGASKLLVETFAAQVPQTMDELLQLPGVARKTANVVLGNAFGKNEGVVVDTHVRRLATRLGLTRHTGPEKIEEDLMKVIPRSQWSVFSHWLIWHGRRRCFARKPDCEGCEVQHLCPSAFKAVKAD